jgi:hypothetical protein
MPDSAINKERILTEQRLTDEEYDFFDAYLAAKYLYSQISSHPESETPHTITAFLTLIESDKFESESQSLFLYRS